jgi:two-component system, LytTR family, sensor kinase
MIARRTRLGTGADAAPVQEPAASTQWRAGLWIPIFTAWCIVFGVMFAARDRFWAAALGREDLAWTDALLQGLVQASSITLLMAAALLVAWRFPLERRGLAENVALHTGIGAVIILVNVLLLHGVFRLLMDGEGRTLAAMLVGFFPAACIMYATMLGGGYGIQYFHRYRDRELRASQLESQLAHARLQALNMQLHPHFLFNTLNSISALMHRDVRAADRTLSRLEDLLRLTLDNSEAQEVPLRDELRVLEPYLEIEQTRFGDRLQVEWAVEPHLLEAAVPQLILQPLVENAIKYGIAPRSTPGRIRVSAREVGSMLELEVSDNGPGLNWKPLAARSAGTGAAATGVARGGCGVGLANTRERLRQMYPRQHQLVLGDQPGGGARVHIRFPLRFLPRTPVAA